MAGDSAPERSSLQFLMTVNSPSPDSCSGFAVPGAKEVGRRGASHISAQCGIYGFLAGAAAVTL